MIKRFLIVSMLTAQFGLANAQSTPWTWTAGINSSNTVGTSGYELISDTGSSRTYRFFSSVKEDNLEPRKELFNTINEKDGSASYDLTLTLNGPSKGAVPVTVSVREEGYTYVRKHDPGFPTDVKAEGSGDMTVEGAHPNGESLGSKTTFDFDHWDTSDTAQLPGRHYPETPNDIKSEFNLKTGDTIHLTPSLATKIHSGGIAGGSANLKADWGGIDPKNGLFVTVSVVPEPETYAMLLAGLGLLGFVARRKKNTV